MRRSRKHNLLPMLQRPSQISLLTRLDEVIARSHSKRLVDLRLEGVAGEGDDGEAAVAGVAKSGGLSFESADFRDCFEAVFGGIVLVLGGNVKDGESGLGIVVSF